MAVARAYVNPAILVWARTRAGADIGDVARAAAVRPDVVQAWEDGRAEPTFLQARKVAARLHVPFGLLWLPVPPIDAPLPTDFRGVAGAPPPTPSLGLRDEIARVRVLQAWYREWLEEHDADPLPFVRSADPDDPAEAVAASIDATLGGLDAIRRSHGGEDFVREVLRSCERARLVVISNGVVGHDSHRPLSVDEFRGFVLVDDLAPVIYLNRRDAPTARAFTLAHELAHVWFGVSAIDRPDGTVGMAPGQVEDVRRRVERACNRVAAALLMPETTVRAHASAIAVGDGVVESVARAFRVSRAAARVRLHDLGVVAEPWIPLDGALGGGQAPRARRRRGRLLPHGRRLDWRTDHACPRRGRRLGRPQPRRGRAHARNRARPYRPGTRGPGQRRDRMTAPYWLDSSTFIDLDRMHYHHDVAPGFWDFVDARATEGTLRSCRSVHDEIRRGTDWLSAWVAIRADTLFAEVEADTDVQARLTEVMARIYEAYDLSFANEFAKGADPFLVAIVLARGGTLVTEEIKRTQPPGATPKRRAPVRLLDVCASFRVPTVAGHRAAQGPRPAPGPRPGTARVARRPTPSPAAAR